MRAVVISALWLGLLFGNTGFALKSDIKMTSGWSVSPDVKVAVKETFDKIRKKGAKSPKFILYYTTSHYDSKELVKLVNQQFPKAKTFGMQVYKGVFTEDGLHIGKNGSLAAMTFEGDILVGMAGMSANPENLQKVEEEAAKMVKAAYSTIEKQSGPPQFVLLGGQLRATYGVLNNIKDLATSGAKLIGGAAVKDNWANGETFVGDNIYPNGFNFAVFYTNKKVGTYMHSGFTGKKKKGVITKIEGFRLKEIDGKKAADVYREWAGPEVSKTIELGKGQPHLSSHPLGRGFKSKNGIQHIAINPWIFHPDGSITIGVYMEKGEEIFYIEGSRKVLVDRTGVVSKRALVDGKIKFKDLAGGIHLYCAGASSHVGLGETGAGVKLVENINKAMKGSPLIGAFTNSEQGTIPGMGYFDGNLMSSMAVFER